MATKKKMLQAAAGSATGGAGLDITDVFSTYLFKPNTSGTYPIVNNIDLDAEGGMVWMKRRDYAGINIVHDTERWGGSNGGYLRTDSDSGSASTAFFSSFNSDGFTPQDLINHEMASWTFRKAPKFFDVVTYTGDGVQGRTVSHNLGVAPAVVIIKRTDSTSNWGFYVIRPSDYDILNLNTTAGISATYNYSQNIVLSGSPSETDLTLSSGAATNASGGAYVAYLFAHNDGDGEFGPSGDQDIIKCGSYTGNGSTTGPEIDLGFEPQWVLIKEVDATGNWQLFDSMRGMVTDGSDARIAPNLSSAEDSIQSLTPTATGFKINTTSGNINTNNSDHIYMAIRRGPLAQPESGTEVFAIDTKTTPEPAYNSGFVVDMAIQRNISVSTSNATTSRLLQKKRLLTDSTNAEENSTTFMFDYNTGWSSDAGFNDTNNYSWMWKRAPGFFDVVAYTGSNSDLNVSHNLGAVPEMMWVKCRSGFTENWTCYHKDLGNTKEIKLNTTGVPVTSSVWANTTPTENVFTVDGDKVPVSKANTPYIAYLFASLDGISKVGSYTGNGGTLTVDCGFTSGARFVLFRNITTSNGDWTVADTGRGMVSGNDRALNLNDTSAEITDEDFIDPHSSGFTVVNASGYVDSNTNGHTYLFYAIA